MNKSQPPSWRWEELSAPQINAIARRQDAVALVPVGAIEQHGPHLPAGTDSFLATKVCLAATAQCWERSTPVLVAPCLWLGCSSHHVDLGGTLTARLPTFVACIEDIASSLFEAGFARQIFVNGHGGNVAALDSAVAEIGARTPVRPLALSYFNLVRETAQQTRRSPEGGMGHAGEFETALMQYLHLDLVGEIPTGEARPLSHSSLRRDMFAGGEAVVFQKFSELSASGVVGMPQHACVQNGELWFDACVRRLVEAIGEWSTMPLEEINPTP